MGNRSYPPLKPAEVVAILEALKFTFKRQNGSHAHYELEANGMRYVVTVDMAVPEFWTDLIKSMIRQSGFTKDQFYGATKKTRKKI